MPKGLMLREILPSLDLIFVSDTGVIYNATCDHLPNIYPNDYVVIEFRHDGTVDFILAFENQEREDMKASYSKPSAKDLYDYVSTSYRRLQTEVDNA